MGRSKLNVKKDEEDYHGFRLAMLENLSRIYTNFKSNLYKPYRSSSVVCTQETHVANAPVMCCLGVLMCQTHAKDVTENSHLRHVSSLAVFFFFFFLLQMQNFPGVKLTC